MIRLMLSSLKVLTIVISTGLVALGGTRLFDHYLDQAQEEAGVGENVNLTITKKDDEDSVAEKLRKAGLIRSETAFKLTLKYVSRDIRPNTYTLRRGMPVATIVDSITTEKSKAVTENKSLTLTVIEGWRTEQIAEEYDKIGGSGGDKGFMKAVREYPHDAYDFLEGSKAGSLEGFLFPLTYEFKSDAQPEEVITQMLNAFDQAVTEDLRDRANKMGLTLYEVLKLASYVERETAAAEERPLVADVYLKRFADEEGVGWTLGADPTVQYAVAPRAGEWWPRLDDDDTKTTDSPYNLYRHQGLTPTPICNPSLFSITAVLEPAESPFFYFTARNDESGRHLFAETNEDQNYNQSLVDAGADLSEFDDAYLEYLPD